MSYIIGAPGTHTGTAYTLGGHDDFFNFAGDTVYSKSDALAAIDVNGDNNSLDIAGHILGTFRAIDLGDVGTSHGNTLNIQASGVVASSMSSSEAIAVKSSMFTINNAGTILGAEAIRIVASTGAGTSTITNSGTIKSLFDAILLDGDANENLTLINTGIIQAESSRSYYGDSGIDRIVNSGTMIGRINLFENNDVYDGRLGKVLANPDGGFVEGGSGNDTLTGGKSVDDLRGGDDNDLITGGLAKDMLSGGTGIDKFYFNALAERGDTITDFTTDDFIMIKSTAFGSLPKGMLSAAAFWANDTGLAHDANDRIIFEKDADRLWYDADGNGKGAAVLLVDFTLDVNMTRADIFVI